MRSRAPRLLTLSLSIALSALLSGVAMAQTLPEKMTYQGRAERVPRLLENWSADFKVRLEAGPQFQNEVVLVDVQDRSTDEVMKQLAVVTAGRWEKITSGGFRLVMDSEARSTRSRIALDRKVKDIRKQLAEMIRPSSAPTSPPPPTVVGATPASPAGDSEPIEPSASALVIPRILTDMDLRPIARLKRGERLVYSSRPTRMQVALPGSAAEYIASYIKEHNVMASGAQPAVDDAQMASMAAFMTPEIKEMMARERRQIYGYSKAVLVISEQEMFGRAQAELRLYDQKGAIVASTQSMLDQGWMQTMQEEAAEITGRPAPGAAKSTPVTYSADSLAFSSLRASYAEGKVVPAKPIDPAVKARILDVVNIDPLSLSATDELLAYAKSEKKPIIACLTDESEGFMAALIANKQTVEQVKKAVEGGELYTVEPNPDYILFRPADEDRARAIRTDRNAFSKLLKAATPEGGVRLNDLATFAATNPDIRSQTVFTSYLASFLPNVASNGFTSQFSWELLRFYHRINPLVGQRLAAGESVALSTFDTRPVAVMVYGAPSSLRADRGKPRSKFSYADMMMAFMPGGGIDYKDEPTEALPNGLPSDAVVTVAVTQEPCLVIPSGEKSEIGLGSAGLDEMALMQYMMSQKELAAAIATSMPKMPKMLRGERTIYEFTFQFADGLSVRQSLTDQTIPKGAALIEFGKYPADIQKLIDARIEEIKKSPFASIGAMMGALGKGNQPPP